MAARGVVLKGFASMTFGSNTPVSENMFLIVSLSIHIGPHYLPSESEAWAGKFVWCDV